MWRRDAVRQRRVGTHRTPTESLPHAHITQAAEALRRAKFKFPGRQKVVASRNWGFTQYARDDFVQWKREGRLVNCGVHAQVGAGWLAAVGG